MKTTYTTKAGVTHTIKKTIDGLFDIGFDGCATLEEAKEQLERIDSPNNRLWEIEAFNQFDQ